MDAMKIFGVVLAVAGAVVLYFMWKKIKDNSTKDDDKKDELKSKENFSSYINPVEAPMHNPTTHGGENARGTIKNKENVSGDIGPVEAPYDPTSHVDYNTGVAQDEKIKHSEDRFQEQEEEIFEMYDQLRDNFSRLEGELEALKQQLKAYENGGKEK